MPIAWALTWLQSFVLEVPEEFFIALEELVRADTPAELLWLLFLIALTPAICEELVFRGVLLQGLASEMTGRRAIIGSAIIFGAFHLSTATAIRFLPTLWLGLLLGLSAIFAHMDMWGVHLLVLGVLLILATTPFRVDDRPLASAATTIFGVVYPAALLAFLIPLRMGGGPGLSEADAFWLTLTVFLLVWSADTFAYFVGKAIGKHPLAPKVSPKKTWEGAVGGAVGAIVVAAVLRLTLLDFLPWGHLLVVALVCGALSQIGDLAESKMKRAVGAKDSGTLLPGHGGLLDRLDALILAVPLVYVYLALVGVLHA